MLLPGIIFSAASRHRTHSVLSSDAIGMTVSEQHEQIKSQSLCDGLRDHTEDAEGILTSGHKRTSGWQRKLQSNCGSWRTQGSAVKRCQSWKEQRPWCSASRVTRRRGESDLRPCVSETEALGCTGSLWGEEVAGPFPDKAFLTPAPASLGSDTAARPTPRLPVVTPDTGVLHSGWLLDRRW